MTVFALHIFIHAHTCNFLQPAPSLHVQAPGLSHVTFRAWPIISPSYAYAARFLGAVTKGVLEQEGGGRVCKPCVIHTPPSATHLVWSASLALKGSPDRKGCHLFNLFTTPVRCAYFSIYLTKHISHSGLIGALFLIWDVLEGKDIRGVPLFQEFVDVRRWSVCAPILFLFLFSISILFLLFVSTFCFFSFLLCFYSIMNPPSSSIIAGTEFVLFAPPPS